MRVTEHLDKANETLISFEIIPPKRGGDIKELLSVLEDLVKYNHHLLILQAMLQKFYTKKLQMVVIICG